MTSKDAVDLSLKLIDVLSKASQFLIVITIAFGGWLVSANVIEEYAALSVTRLLMAALYFFPAAGVWYGAFSAMTRASNCMRLAVKLAQLEGMSDEDISLFARDSKYLIIIVSLAVPAMILTIATLIIFLPMQGETV